MTVEIIWKELNCPLLGGALCERSACMASSCGNTYPLYFYDREETKEYEEEEMHVEYTGWWFWRKRVETKTVKKHIDTRWHYSKKLIRSYITCSQHNGNNIGIKIEVKDIDEYSDWVGDNGGWITVERQFKTPIEKLQENIQEARESIERGCVYDSLE